MALAERRLRTVMNGTNNLKKPCVSRPERSLIERLRAHTVATVYESMGRSGAMNYEIKPLQKGMKICAPAWTVKCAPGAIFASLKAAEGICPGYLLLIDVGGVKEAASAGLELVHYLRSQGVAGLVGDGAVRDSDALLALDFPVFCRGLTPRASSFAGCEFVRNRPVACAGVLVNPGDVVIGDDDGVAVIPKEDLERVLTLCDAHMEGEHYRLGMMDQGFKMDDIYNCEKKARKLMENA